MVVSSYGMHWNLGCLRPISSKSRGTPERRVDVVTRAWCQTTPHRGPRNGGTHQEPLSSVARVALRGGLAALRIIKCGSGRIHFSRSMPDLWQLVFLPAKGLLLRRSRGVRTGTHGAGHLISLRGPVRIAFGFPVLPQAENVVAIGGECLDPLARIAQRNRCHRAEDGHQVLISPLVLSDHWPKHDDAVIQGRIALMRRRIIDHRSTNHSSLGWFAQAFRRLTMMPFPPRFLKTVHPGKVSLLDAEDREFPILGIVNGVIASGFT